MKKKLALALVAAMIVTTLAGCGGSSSSASGTSSASGSASAPAASGEKTKITLATGSTSANYYAIGGVLSTVLNPVLTKSEINVTSTGASKANVQLMQDNEANFAILQNDVAY